MLKEVAPKTIYEAILGKNISSEGDFTPDELGLEQQFGIKGLYESIAATYHRAEWRVFGSNDRHGLSFHIERGDNSFRMTFIPGNWPGFSYTAQGILTERHGNSIEYCKAEGDSLFFKLKRIRNLHNAKNVLEVSLVDASHVWHNRKPQQQKKSLPLFQISQI